MPGGRVGVGSAVPTKGGVVAPATGGIVPTKGGRVIGVCVPTKGGELVPPAAGGG